MTHPPTIRAKLQRRADAAARRILDGAARGSRDEQEDLGVVQPGVSTKGGLCNKREGS